MSPDIQPPYHDHERTFHVGRLVGSVLGLGIDAYGIVSGFETALGSGARPVRSGGAAAPVAVPAAAAGVATVIASGAAAIGHGRNLIDTLDELRRPQINHSRGDGSADTTGGTLADAERQQLQNLADDYNTTIDVVGSRAARQGRNIHADLLVGNGPGTRSDIDVIIDGQVDIDARGGLSGADPGGGQWCRAHLQFSRLSRCAAD